VQRLTPRGARRRARGDDPAVRRRRGALMLAAGAILVALAWWQPNPFASPTEVRALFADSAGLARIGAEVRVAGTKVGDVVGREREGRLALVTMEVDGVDVHTDATAELRPRLLFEGTSYVDLEPGSPGARELGDSALPASQTSAAVSVADALGVLDAPARESLQTDADALARGLDGDALQSTLRQAPDLTRDLATVTHAARGSDQDGLRRAVAGFARVSRAVGRERDDLVPLARGVERTSAAADRPALDADLAALPPALEDVRTGAGAASRVLDRLDPLARDLRPAVDRLQPTLAAVRPLARAATPVLRDASPLVRDLRLTVRDGARAAPGARRLLAAVDPTLRIFSSTLLDALERKTSLGTPAYLSFLGLFAGGGGASRPFIGDEGHFMRFGFRFLTGAGRPAPPCALLAQVSPDLAEAFGQSGVCQS
jgi:ABC-type transporter Mla subunit MlaD